MQYQKATIKDGHIKITEPRMIDQNTLTSDCWLIQFEGLSACKTCGVKNTPDCGGGKTLKDMRG